jgi:hypothetical protein
MYSRKSKQTIKNHLVTTRQTQIVCTGNFQTFFHDFCTVYVFLSDVFRKNSNFDWKKTEETVVKSIGDSF